MSSSRLALRAFLLSGLTIFMATVPAAADPAPKMTVENLQAVVTGLGYEAKVEKQVVRFTASGKRDIPIVLVLSDDATFLYINAQVETVAPAKIAKIPAIKLLEYNDTHPDFFSLNKNDSGETIYLISELPTSTVKPQSLREVIDRLGVVLDAQAELLDQDSWK